jgi:hypothetical protein
MVRTPCTKLLVSSDFPNSSISQFPIKKTRICESWNMTPFELELIIAVDHRCIENIWRYQMKGTHHTFLTPYQALHLRQTPIRTKLLSPWSRYHRQSWAVGPHCSSATFFCSFFRTPREMLIKRKGKAHGLMKVLFSLYTYQPQLNNSPEQWI